MSMLTSRFEIKRESGLGLVFEISRNAHPTPVRLMFRLLFFRVKKNVITLFMKGQLSFLEINFNQLVVLSISIEDFLFCF